MLESLYKNTVHINSLRASGYGAADFRIEVKPLYFKHSDMQIPVPNRVVSYRPDTGAVLGVHSNRYNITEHIPVIEAIRSSVERSDVNARGIQETISVANKGARLIHKIVLPEHTIKTPDGDTAALSFLGINSFDGSFPLILSVGANQSACQNGQVFTKDAAAMYKSRHTKGLDIDLGARIISKGIEVMEKESDLWHKWAKTSVNRSHMLSVIEDMLGIQDYTTTKSKAYAYILDQYENHYSPLMGDNYWALYNAFTDWSTHAPIRGNKSNVTLMRQKKVQDVLNKFPYTNFHYYSA
jgi:hypothetical protein